MVNKPYIQYVKDGEAVAAGTPNRPISQLAGHVEALAEAIDASNTGSMVVAWNQTVVSSAVQGSPVFFNSSTQQFELAYAATETDPDTGYIKTSASSQVWGVVLQKGDNATLADILLFGYVNLDISAVVPADELVDSEVPAGLWYLSSTGAGMLTQQRPPVSVPVLRTDTSGNVFLNSQFADFLNNHRHYQFDLEMVPAGETTPPAVGEDHAITSPDSALSGWLPADDAIFNGNAPAGAKFGYNLSQDASLQNAFPPLPLESAVVIMQRPSVWDTTSNARRNYGQQLEEDTVVLDRNGIWWMSDCYDSVPWPTDLDTTSSASMSLAECDPLGMEYSLKLYFAKVNFATDNAVVSSLRSDDPRITITCSGSEVPAATGDLEISLDLSFTVDTDLVKGYTALKSYDPGTGVFRQGYITEGVYSTSNNVLISGDTSFTDSGRTIYQGLVSIGFLNQASQELASQLVRLDGATEEDYPVLYIGLSADIAESTFVVKFEVPADAPDSATFSYRARLIGRAAGTLPQLTVEYYTAARPPAGLTTPEPVTQAYTAMTIVTVATLANANESVEATSESVTVAPGDVVYVRVTRDTTAPGDTYAGELGIMQQVGVLTTT